MSTTITKRELITHELKWYWKNPQLRKEIRSWSESGAVDVAPQQADIPDLNESDLMALLAHNSDALVYQVLLEQNSSELYALYRYVFLRDENYAVQVEISPLTDKLGRYVLPYEGVMMVYAMADRLISAYREGHLELSEDADLWLCQLRFMAARRLHLFTKNLTRLNADRTPTYGVCVTGHKVAQFYLRRHRVLNGDIELACQTYPGEHLNSYEVVLTVRPTGMDFRTVGKVEPTFLANVI